MSPAVLRLSSLTPKTTKITSFRPVPCNSRTRQNNSSKIILKNNENLNIPFTKTLIPYKYLNQLGLTKPNMPLKSRWEISQKCTPRAHAAKNSHLSRQKLKTKNFSKSAKHAYRKKRRSAVKC